ncbi:MAG: TlpA disulfide reductase family protein [Gemmatimonadota bacterium]|jgi:thiol-disulfide isomerase/thioredoxin
MNLLFVRLASAGFVLVGAGIIYLLLRRRERRRRVLPWLGAFAGLAMAGVGAAGLAASVLVHAAPPPDPPTAEELSRPAPDFAFRLVDDDSVATLAGLRGRVVVVNLWATWCVGCVKELPDLDRLQRVWSDSGVVVLTLSSESRRKLLRFARDHAMPGLNGYVPDVSALPEPFRRGFQGFPTTYVLDGDGYIRDYSLSGHSYRQLAAKVRPLLAEPGG